MSPAAETTAIADAAARIALVADPGAFDPFDEDVVASDPLRFVDDLPYLERLRSAREATGGGESVLTGRALLRGAPTVVVASDFGFLGGSIGGAAAERIARAFERAAELRLPLLALVASGGSRMQEGTLALVQMAKLADAARRFRTGGGLFVSYLMDPTTGGTLASWASLASVILAEPGARVGFAGPRVAAALAGAPIEAEAQRAEALQGAGWVDEVVPLPLLGDRLELLLAATRPASGTKVGGSRATVPVAPGELDPWSALQAARDPARFGVRDLAGDGASHFFELHGDRRGSPDDAACLAALIRVGGRPMVLVAHDRKAGAGVIGPAGLGKARRAMRFAEELGLPLLTMIDTPGAELSAAAERRGLAGEVAQTLETIAAVSTPTVSVLIGQGGSGGAVALLPADRTIALSGAGLWVLPPEAASALLFRDSGRAPELARAQAGSAADLHRYGLVERLVEERREAHSTAAELWGAIGATLEELEREPPEQRLRARQRRLRNLASKTWKSK